MPRIQLHRAEGSVPWGSENVMMPTSVNPVTEAIGYAGRQLGHAADTLGGYLIAERRADEALQAGESKYTIKDLSNSALEEIKTYDDYENFFDNEGNPTGKVKQALDNVREQSLSSITSDSVKKRITPYLDSQLTLLKQAARLRKADLISKKTEVLAEKTVSSAARDAALAQTPEEKQKALDIATLEIQAMHSNGGLKKPTEKYMEGFYSNYFTELKSIDPIRADKELKDLSNGSYASLLNSDDRAKLIKENEPYAKEQKTNASYLAAMEATGNDNAKAIELVTDPKFMKEHGLDLKENKQVIDMIQNNLTAKKQAYDTSARKQMGVIRQKITTHQKVSQKDLEGLDDYDKSLMLEVQDRQNDEDRREAREREHLNVAKRTEARQTRIEKSQSLYGGILLKLAAGESVTERDILKAEVGGLRKEDASHLYSLVGKADKRYDPGLLVIKKAHLDETEKQKAAYYFKQQVDQERATGQRVIEIAEWYLKKPKEDYVKNLMDGISNLWNSAFPQPQRKTPAAQPTLSPEEQELQRRGYKKVNGTWVK